ncbi:tetratricopeptide repeat-containing sensor histidine kinase [uncultured Sunxiuqinia sp.]|uniref:tetratricopeptide repeat-containing sensor histidine kinase n=1 Tax=uncultured Sunxiuqinia sp. TaxID=1573825 RepID=UPI0030D8EE52|tara:strand:- start:41939 stop:43900 length:1962 start_codon:yes stop_codon:yes gene_type:complete
MKFLIYPILLLFLIQHSGFAQTVDSLLIRAESPNELEAIGALKKLGSGEFDSLPAPRLDYLRKAHQLARKIDDAFEIADSWYFMGQLFHESGELDSARYYFERSLAGFQSPNHREKLVDCLNYLGVVHKVSGNYAKALECQLKALPIRMDLGNQREIARTFNNLGNIYSAISDTTKAIDAYSKGKQIAENTNDTIATIYLGLNIGRLLVLKGQYQESLPILNEVRRYAQAKDFSIGQSASANLLAYIAQEQDLDEKALELANEALAIAIDKGLMDRAADSYGIIGDYYKKKKQYVRSLEFHSKALQTANEHELVEIQEQQHESISKLHELLENPGEALNHYKKHIALRDSIYNHENELKLAYVEYQHELETKERENTFLEQEFEKQKQYQSFTYILIVLLLLIIIMLVVLRFEHKQARQYLTELNEQKDRMFTLISHDLRGPIGSVKSIFDLIKQENIQDPKELRVIIDESSDIVDNSYNLLENLLNWVRSQTGRLKVNPEPISIAEVVDQTLKLFAVPIRNKKLQIITQIREEHIVFADREMIKSVVRNLISNATKFTFPEGEIKISTEQSAKRVQLIVKDSGTGMNPETISQILDNKNTISQSGTENEKGTGIGLRLCLDFIERNMGRLEIKSKPGKGASFRVSLPVANSQ